MNAKAKGSRQERRTVKLLEANGYACTRAAASPGTFDVIGISATDFVAVQVKSNEWPRSDELETLRHFRVPANCRKLVHRWRDGQRLPDVKELA